MVICKILIASLATQNNKPFQKRFTYLAAGTVFVCAIHLQLKNIQIFDLAMLKEFFSKTSNLI
jgi:hypothetical protein